VTGAPAHSALGSAGQSATAGRGRLLVVSHACSVAVNQAVYVELAELGWHTIVVVPDRWRHEYQAASFMPRPLDGMERSLVPLRVIRPGKPQRHLYLTRPLRLLRAFKPDVVFLEEELFSVPAAQWGQAAYRARIPFGVQAAENLDRALPLPARLIRWWMLRRATFVAARSPTARALAARFRARGEIVLSPHGVPPWLPPRRARSHGFTVGFAGRLVAEKGVRDLVEAIRLLDGDVRLLLVGDGPLREELERAPLGEGKVEIRTSTSHDRMAEAYAEMDVLVLPSRSTDKWTEQFGRVLVEALWCGTPVVGSDSGEIPWVVETTRGGRLYPEGDVEALARVLRELRGDRGQRRDLARRGQASVKRLFSIQASAASLDGALVRATGRSKMPAESEPSRQATVALVAHGIHDTGGMERAFAELVRRASAEFRFVILSRDLAPELRSLVDWRRIPIPARPIPVKFVLFYALAGLRLLRTRADLVHTLGALVPNKADLASVHFCHAGFRSTLAGRRETERPPLRRLNSSLSRGLGLAAERWSYRGSRVRLLAAVSAGVERELTEHYPTVRTVVAPNGVDGARFCPDSTVRAEVRRSLGVGDAEIVALFVGSDWDHKGLRFALEGIAEARRLGSPPVQLWVLGRGDERRYGAIADRLQVGGQVRFLGFTTEPVRHYQAADIFVLPSLYETFSLVAFEAASCGLPVVAAKVSGVDELVGADESGILVQRSGTSVGTALARLAADPDLRRRMGANGRRRSSLCTWERSAEILTRSYRELLPRPIASSVP
jgi:glycosyltransferase involved in cell wall biosynthesis